MSLSASPPSYHAPHPVPSYPHRRRSTKPSISINKLHISSPSSLRQSRQSSTSSISSSYSSRSTSPSSPIDLSQRATEILNTIYNTHAPSSLTPLIHPSAHFTHEYVNSPQNISSRSDYIQHWQQKLAKFPDFSATIKECAVDESQGKVWVVSDVVCDSEGLRRRQVVDMLTFDAEGVLVEGNGFFRRMSSRVSEE